MPATSINVVSVPRSGQELVFLPVDLDNGNFFANDGHTLVCLNNPGTADVTVTFATTMKPDADLSVSNRVVTVGAGKVFVVVPFDPAIFNAPDGTVSFTCSGMVVVGIGSIG